MLSYFHSIGRSKQFELLRTIRFVIYSPVGSRSIRHPLFSSNSSLLITLPLLPTPLPPTPFLTTRFTHPTTPAFPRFTRLPHVITLLTLTTISSVSNFNSFFNHTRKIQATGIQCPRTLYETNSNLDLLSKYCESTTPLRAYSCWHALVKMQVYVCIT
jgi:hypothetical protein